MATVITPRPAPLPGMVIYPETDGQPMAESDLHARYMIDTRVALAQHFADRPDVYVSGNLFLYYVEGDPGQVVAPDVFVVFGVEKRPRPIYKLWEEGKVPDFVLEITSASTRHHDTGVKHGLYALLGIPEYFLFDPLGDHLRPALRGYALRHGQYTAIDQNASGGLPSEALGLELRLREGGMRFYDPASERWLPAPGETAEALRQAQARVAAEAAARREAETRVSSAVAAQRQAEDRASAEATARREAEARAAAAEAELARLRAQLEQRTDADSR